MTPTLTPTDVELLGGLKDDPAYILLLDKVKALVDDLTDRLHAADAETNRELFPYWKALRTIYLELRDTPQEFANLLMSQGRESYGMDVKPPINNQLKEYYLKLQGIQAQTAQEMPPVRNTLHTSDKGFKNLI